MINLSFWSVAFTIINIIVLFLLLKKFLIGPVNRIMAEREELIQSSIADANQTKDDAKKLKQQYEDTLAGVQAECDSMRDKSRQAAQNEYNRILADAGEKSNRMIQDAEKTIKIEREKALSDMESQIAGLAMSAAAKILGEDSNEAINQSLYDEFIEKTGEAHDTESN